MSECFVGIDVAGSQKGFHVALLVGEHPEVRGVFWSTEVQEVAEAIGRWHPMPGAIAIDCPPRALRRSSSTRLAERQLHQKGYRVQWTRREGDQEPLEWMLNGQRIWQALSERFFDSLLIETFPTAASDRLEACDVLLPLHFLAGRLKRAYTKDYVDAAICAWVAREAAAGRTETAGRDERTGETDELGLIHY